MGVQEPLALLREQPAGADPVGLTLVERRKVAFSGRRGGEGPLTLGQAGTLGWITDQGLYTRMLDWPLELPAGATLDDITAALRVLVARHESLRTTYPAGRDPVQRVARTGELAIDVYSIDAKPADVSLLGAELVRHLRSTEFDRGADLPLRAAVAVHQGVPVATVTVCDHMAVDFGSMAVIGRQFTQLAGEPARRDIGPPGHQPLDQAAAERSPRGRRRAEAALRSWEKHLRRMPQCMYPVPRQSGPGGGAASGWLWSPAAALALPHIAARTRASRPVAVLAALSAVISWRAGHDRCVLPVSASNRYERTLREYVGTLAQDSIMSIEVRAQGFDELVRRTAAAMLKSGRNGLVSRDEIIRIGREVEDDRGITYTRDCTYNDLTAYLAEPAAATAPGDPAAGQPAAAGDPAAARRALRHSRFSCLTSAPVQEVLLFILQQIDAEMILGALTTDASRVPGGEIESLLRGVELLLVEAASGDVDLGRLGEITGVRPLPRGPGWLRVDSSWVEFSEVQRLLDDALPGVAAKLFDLAKNLVELERVLAQNAAFKKQSVSRAGAVAHFS